jgi:hypothetical protein
MGTSAAYPLLNGGRTRASQALLVADPNLMSSTIPTDSGCDATNRLWSYLNSQASTTLRWSGGSKRCDCHTECRMRTFCCLSLSRLFGHQPVAEGRREPRFTLPVQYSSSGSDDIGRIKSVPSRNLNFGRLPKSRRPSAAGRP